jgi:plasmid maintenance system antidote protein VapI
MGFWKNVDNELKYRGFSRKELALSIEMKEQSLHKAIERDSEVSAITALKIARFLQVSIESLLELEEIKTENLHTFTEAKKIAQDYTTLSLRDRELINCLIEKMKN